MDIKEYISIFALIDIRIDKLIFFHSLILGLSDVICGCETTSIHVIGYYSKRYCLLDLSFKIVCVYSTACESSTIFKLNFHICYSITDIACESSISDITNFNI